MSLRTRLDRDALNDLALDPEWFQGVCDEIACGVGIKAILWNYGIHCGTFFRWIGEDPERERLFRRAKEIRSQAEAEMKRPAKQRQAAIRKPDKSELIFLTLILATLWAD